MMRERLLLDTDWRFHEGEIEVESTCRKGPLYAQAKTERYRRGPAAVAYLDHQDDYGSPRNMPYMPEKREITHEKWERVTVPHDYVIGKTPHEEGNNALGFLDQEPAWYRKHLTFSSEDEGKRLVLYFEGVTDRCEVFFNGSPMVVNDCGYVPFEVDITDFVRFGEDNVIAVHIIPIGSEGWWYNGGGIYRDVWLEKTELVAVERYGVFVAPKKVSDGTWEVPVSVEVRNSGYEAVCATVKTTLLDSHGKTVGELRGQCKVAEQETVKVEMCATVENPQLWDIDSPVLYSAVTEIYCDGVPVDRYEVPFGFRTLEFTADRGLFLNGRHVKLKGVCGHGDFGLTGKAVPDNIHRLKVRMIKEMGANAYRCSHYPQADCLMDEFDKQGILVMAETRWFSSAPSSLDDLRTLVRRDRNHPSVIMWSVGNEEFFFIKSQGERIAMRMTCEVKKLDPTRPVMTANDKTPEQCTLYGVSDLIGINYNLQLFEQIHEKYPYKPIFSSENCATGSTRGWYYEEDANHGYLPAYDRDTNEWFLGREKTWKYFMEREWHMGGFQWIAFEHRGEAVWPRLCSQSGAIDLYLQRKDAFYQNQSLWSEKPMIHLLPHWNFFERRGEEIAVWAYTNCDEAEMFLDGESLGRKAIEPFGHGEWLVTYRPGKLEVVGYRNGEKVATDMRETADKPVALRLRAENAEDVCANGKDIALFTCVCVDGEGREVPDASPFVRFHTNALGTVVGTGSDVSDHVAVTCPDRRMRAGAISIAVRVGKTSGTLTLYAHADGLDSASFKLQLS